MTQPIPEEARAFGQKYYGRLSRYLVVKGCPPELAEEIANDAILIVVDRWERLRTDPAHKGRSPDTYLYTVATNLWHKKGPAEGKWQAFLAAGSDSAVFESTVCDVVDAGEVAVDRVTAWAVAQSILLKIQLPLREVLWLRHAEDFSVKQTAAILKIAEGTVKERLHRGIKEFKNLVHTSGAIKGTKWDVAE